MWKIDSKDSNEYNSQEKPNNQLEISFIITFRCYHEKLANVSISYVRSIYAQTTDPQCTLLEDIIDDQPIVAAVGNCAEWIYAYDRGYRSITTDVS